MSDRNQQIIEDEWVSFPGGELEGKRPKAPCSVCRHRGYPSHTLCFQCYRADHGRSPGEALLPFEPVNRARLAGLKAERVVARAALREGTGKFEERRRQAQIGARRALERIEAALEARKVEPATRMRVMASAVHAAELQLPESWLPFVVAG